MDAAFQKVRVARAAFAAESMKVFAKYNEILSDTLFTLEEEGSREAAFEANRRIRPVMAELQAETRLLKRQREELYVLTRQICSSIDEVFEQANKQSAQEFNRIRADIERLDTRI